MSTFTAEPIYELTGITDNICNYNIIHLIEYNNIINDTEYIYSGLTLHLIYSNFCSHFDTSDHMYSNVILNNDIFIYTGITGETHYFQIVEYHEDIIPFIDPLLSPLTEQEVIDGFTSNIIRCAEQLSNLTEICCPVQKICNKVPIVLITNEGGGSDNCDDFLARNVLKGWTLDFIFNKNGDENWSESVFWFKGVRDEYDVENFADNGLSFRFTTDGKIQWVAYRYSGYCNSVSGYTAMYYVDSGKTENALCTNGTINDFNITITFEKNNIYDNNDECDLSNEGGWGDLIISGTTEKLNSKWNNNRYKRLGTLKIYHNARLVYKIKNWEDVILSNRGYQPFTHVIGGGVNGSNGQHAVIFCYIIKYAAYFEDVMDYVYLHNRYLTRTKKHYDISECEKICTPNLRLDPPVVYGLLYNGCVIDNHRNIAAPGFHVPTIDDFNILFNNLISMYGNSGGSAKEIGLFYWNAPNRDATNLSKFNGRGGGLRNTDGDFLDFRNFGYFWTCSISRINNTYYVVVLNNLDEIFSLTTKRINFGLSIRLIKDTTTLLNGQTGIYIGNNGMKYKTICIGNQEWVSSNLIETQYRDKSFILEIRDNATWSTGSCGYCAYDNDWNNASIYTIT